MRFLQFVSLLWIGCQDQKSSWVMVESSDGSASLARHECGFIESQGNFYLIGGRGNKPINIYNPVNNTWTEGATPPVEIHHFQPVAYNGFIFVIGAMTGKYPNEVPITNILVYQIAINQWFVADSIPPDRLRGSGGTVIRNDKIYWVGGIRNGHIEGHSDYLDVFDLKTRTWEELPAAPRARDHFQAVILNDKIL